jgi:hypothetical protein
MNQMCNPARRAGKGAAVNASVARGFVAEITAGSIKQKCRSRTVKFAGIWRGFFEAIWHPASNHCSESSDGPQPPDVHN